MGPKHKSKKQLKAEAEARRAGSFDETAPSKEIPREFMDHAQRVKGTAPAPEELSKPESPRRKPAPPPVESASEKTEKDETESVSTVRGPTAPGAEDSSDDIDSTIIKDSQPSGDATAEKPARVPLQSEEKWCECVIA